MNRIYVFTSTGNSLKLAKDLAAGIGESEIVSIPRLMAQDSWSIEGDRVGFVFPCYYGSVPRLMDQFIRGAEVLSGRYFFALVSAGGSPGIALKALGKSLHERQVRLNYGRSVLLASNYMGGWYYEKIIPDPDRLNRRYKDADRICAEAADEIKAEKESVEPGSLFNLLIPRTLTPSRYYSDSRPWDTEFSIDSGCSGCGTCVDACPVGNITLDQGTPVFHHNCQRCMGCIQFCPQQAFSILGKPMKKIRYKHPEIGKNELFQFHKGEPVSL